MRAFSTILAAASLVSSALAGGACLSSGEATQVANNFKALIATYSDELANATLTVDFTDYSDSVIELINSGCSGPLTLGQPTFSSRAAFEQGQGSQPPIPFNILKTWNNCDTVFLRWTTTVAPNATEEVTGIIVLEATPAPAGNAYNGTSYPWLIETVYSEFNSGAWLVDLGVFVPKC